MTPTPTGIEATHAPMIPREDSDGQLVLASHVARANPHWGAANGCASLAIFQGPHAYMSPAWYPTKRETGKVVPTWLYIAIHAHGRLTAIDDKTWLRRQVEELTDRHEASRTEPWGLSDAPESYIDSMMHGIVGLEFRVERLEGVWKLNQHKSDSDRDGTRQGLEAGGPAGEILARTLADRSK